MDTTPPTTTLANGEARSIRGDKSGTTGTTGTTGGVSAQTGTTAGGRGRRGGRGCHSRIPGRGGGGRGAADPIATTREISNTPVITFEGREDDLKGHVCNIVNISTRASDFVTTT